MKKQRLVFPFLSFCLATSTSSCVLYGVKEVQLVTTDYLEVDLIKREYFINEIIDLSNCIVYGVDYETGEKKEVSYTVRWESNKNLIEDGNAIAVRAGQYRWVFSSEGYKNYSLGISVYEATSESFYIAEYPTNQYFYSNSDTSHFTAAGLVCKRKLTYSTKTDELGNSEETGDTLQKIYDVPIKDCTFTSRINNIDDRNATTLTEGFKFPEGTKGVFTVSVTTASFLNSGKRTSPATYKINVTDSLTSSTLSLNDFDESTITKYNTDDTITLTITNSEISNSRQAGNANYISPDDVDNSFGTDYLREKNDLNQVYCPSKGDVPMLIIPFYFNNEKSHELLTDENLELIDKCFFGNSNDLYFETLRSYYFKSSYGQLNFYGYVAPPFNPQTDGTGNRVIKDVNGLPSLDDNQLVPLIKDAVNFVKRTGVDLRDFDSNGDGYIDALWFISFSPIGLTSISSVGWPHTNNLLNTTPNVSEPTINMFAWTPIGTLTNDFYENQTHNAPGSKGQNFQGDAHTIIHETGHLLGLNDYYSTAGSEVYSFKTNGVDTQATYAPLGGMDFMDKNYLDHNPFSKLLLGWTKPYLVYGNSTITLKPSLYKNQVVVIPYDNFDYSKAEYINDKNETIFNPYDEYLVLDFFTPASEQSEGSYINDNLNTKAYDVYRTTKLTQEGIRIYHVDKRGLVLSNNVYSEPSNPFSLLQLSEDESLACPIINTEYGRYAERGANNRNGSISVDKFPSFDNYCDEIRILTRDPKEFVDGSYVIGTRYDSPNSSMRNQLKVNGVIFPRNSSFSTSSYTVQTEINAWPGNISAQDSRNALSCFGFLSVLMSQLQGEDFNRVYIKISYEGYGKHGFTKSQWDIVTKVFNKQALTQYEQNVYNGLSLPPGFGRASFNNGNLCSYNINIS